MTTGVDAVFTGVMDLLGGGSADDSAQMNAAQGFLVIPRPAFITIVLAAHAANLAAFLSLKEVAMPFEDIIECMHKGCSFCSKTTIRVAFTSELAAAAAKSLSNQVAMRLSAPVLVSNWPHSVSMALIWRAPLQRARRPRTSSS